MGNDDRLDAANALIATALAMNERGINNGTAGNVSVRHADGMLITPSGVPYPNMAATDLIAMNFDTSWTTTGSDSSRLRPSSEWRFHLDILRSRQDANAVVHAHPTCATALSTHSRGIGPFHYMVGVAGGHNIRCAPYATFGGEQLSINALEALVDRKACLLGHHGIIAIGANLDAALALAVEVEVLASQYLAALAIGEPPELTADQMDEVLAKMASPDGYGSEPGAN